jgi:guanine nucleotide-binding protein alpha-1 subunit
MPSRFPYDVNDPITVLLQPPPDETPQQRASRLAAEAEARRVSDEIDARLKQDRAEFKRRKKAVKVLLLGQAESGKSTTLKSACTNTYYQQTCFYHYF